MDLSQAEISAAVRGALEEDVGVGDVTSEATVPADLKAEAVMRAREPLVVAGLEVAVEVFRQVSEGSLKVNLEAQDGAKCPANQILLRVAGRARSILCGERVALNFVQRLSGVATLTAQFVEAIKGTRARILDTRKTTPGLRRLEKYAVKCGGGSNHRIGLFDMILIKDNHLAALVGTAPNPIAAAVARARERFPQLRVEVEADREEQVAQAVAAGADVVLLDNMSIEQMTASVRLAGGRVKTEASGGVNLSTVRRIAETGVDFISVGAITHSARAVDIGLDFQ